MLDIYFIPLHEIFNLGDAPVFVPEFQPDLCRKILSVDENTTYFIKLPFPNISFSLCA
jgi:hypothetical protein